MTKTVTDAATTAGDAVITIKAAGSPALKDGKTITVDLTASDEATNASEIRSVLQSDIDIVNYFDVTGIGADIVLTRKAAAAAESESFDFVLGDAVGIVLGETVAVPGVASVASKFTFSAADKGKSVFIEYVFEADEVEAYDIDENHINPTVQIEIIHETLSKDKTKRYKNNSIISRAQLSGNLDENLAKQHAPTTLNFSAVKPNGTKVVMNKKTEIPL